MSQSKFPNGGELQELAVLVPAEIKECARKMQFWAASQGIKHWQIEGACSRVYANAIAHCAPKLRCIEPRSKGDATRAQEHNSAVHILRRLVVGD